MVVFQVVNLEHVVASDETHIADVQSGVGNDCSVAANVTATEQRIALLYYCRHFYRLLENPWR